MPSIFEGLDAVPVERKKSSIFEGLDARSIPAHLVEQQQKPQVPAELMQPQEESYINQAANVPKRTVGAFTEGLAQSANQMVAAPLLNLAGGAAQGIGYLGGQISPEFQQGAENLAQKAYQARDYYQKPVEVFGNVPEDTLANIAKKSGEMFLPIPGGVAIKGTQAAAKSFPHLAKDIGQAVGAGTALETFKNVPLTGSEGIDDLLKSVAGMALANKAMAPRNAKMVKALDTTVSEAAQARPIVEAALGKALSIGAKPEKAILEAAKETQTSLPANIKLNSWWSHFLANNIFKSIFTGKAWKDVVENSDKSVVNSWKENIDKIHPKDIAHDTANLEYEKALKSEVETTEKQADKLFEYQNEALNSNDKVVPNQTIENIRKVVGNLKSASLSKPSRDVLLFVNKMLNDYAPSVKLSKNMRASNAFDDVHLQKIISEQLKNKIESIPLSELTNQISEILKETDYGANALGVRGKLNFVLKGAVKDVDSVSHLNPEFHARRKVARTFYKNEVGQRIKTDMAQSMLNGQSPKEAMKYMNSPRDIQKLSHILGDFPQKQEVMNGLKRAKFQSLVADKIKNTDGTINYSSLAGMFEKRSELQPLLRELAGENYENLKKLANVAQAITKGGRQLANFSGTSHTTADLKRVGQIVDTILSLGTGAAAVAGNLKTAGIAIATPYVLSRVMANPRYIDAAVQYALARQQHSFKKAMQYQRRMETIFEKEILAKAPLAIQSEEHEK